MSEDGLQREVEAMARLREIEERWRMAHGIDDKLQSKHQQKASARHKRQLERAEARRREKRRQQHIDYAMTRQPSLSWVDGGPRLIKREVQQ
jgi:hypothetical protein